ncbi:MAG TPA: ATP-binding protein [bacterium]|nr:ATP-binding protein [bacterium]
MPQDLAPNSGNSAQAEIQRLRRSICDLVALSAMSAVWSRATAPEIATGLADLLTGALGLELCYLQLRAGNSTVPLEVARNRTGHLALDAITDLAPHLAPYLTLPAPPTAQVTTPDLANGQTLWLSVIPIGFDADCGFLVAASADPSFPSLDDRMFLSVAANQAAVILERQRAEALLAESNSQKDVFLATLAHELRNPLAPLCTGLEMLALPDLEEPIKAEVLGTMQRQAAFLVRLIDDLLDVSRITAGKLELRPTTVQVADVIRLAVEGVQPLLEEARHRLAILVPEEPIYLHADVTRLTQVISNLLNNSCKYMAQGGQIWVTAGVQDGRAQITVRDAGLGIPPEMLGSIFDMFTQVGGPLERTSGGLGLGLTLVRRLVEMHGGSVTAHSEGVGQGSEFVVTLPVAGQTGPQPAGDGQAAAGRGDETQRRVLVVDDNRDAADVLALLLRAQGHEVQVAYDGLDALAVAPVFQPEVVFLDLGMPRLNGYETAVQLRSLCAGRPLTLVALTGWGQEEDKRRTTASGFDYHLVKPAHPDQLAQVLEPPAAR